MPRALVAAFLLLLVACRGNGEGSAFDRAEAAVQGDDFRAAAKLFEEAARTETDAARREEAVQKLANIEWRVLGQPDAAQKRLQQLLAGTKKPVDVHLHLARIAAERRDFVQARAHADRAIAAAVKPFDRRRAMTARAAIVVDDVRDPVELRQTVAALREVIAADGPLLRPSRLLARAGLHAQDGAAALEGINAYYHVSSFSGPPEEIAPAYAKLAAILPQWQGGKDAQLGAALAGIRFFEEAALVGAPPEIVAYAATLRRIEKVANEHYRHIALDDEDRDRLRDGVTAELRALWGTLSWPGAPPRFSFDGAVRELGRRFGATVMMGKTSGHFDLHFAHSVVDSRLAVDQYGRRSSVRFVALDSIVSNGYQTFRTDGGSGDGGWGTATEIYQVRPLYADGPQRDWRRVSDPDARAEYDQKTRDETALDVQRAIDDEPRSYPGMARRLKRQYLDGIYAQLPTRDAFLARVERDGFTYSILLHEGRHAIDQALDESFKTWQLEYRAKLSQVALSDAPRDAVESIMSDVIGGDSPHGRANEQIARELIAWMRANRAAIAGLEAGKPMLPQLDRLTDAQLRAAFRALDPLARGGQ